VSDIKRGVAICHFNRLETLEKLIIRVCDTVPNDCKVVVCDDGSDQHIVSESQGDISVGEICRKVGIPLIQGRNLGVSANKNRALWALQDCNFLCILEDDLFPTAPGWMEDYERAACTSGIHHFCRVQDKEIEETIPAFSNFMIEQNMTPIYGPSPRGDLTFLTSKVLKVVGGFNPNFIGAGYAHGEWTERVVKAGLIPHPLKYVDILEARNKFEQIGDTEGGRWNVDKDLIQAQVRNNRKVLKLLQKTGYIYHPLILT
jgi:glycosyltransferase involved in cell wall biosynthesis